jgi:2,4-dienoyl-CoA reductase-like NADH-dependent reductase (Old Yellow Enzyme family)
VNKRTDEYGGASLDNRARIVFAILDAIKAEVHDDRCALPAPLCARPADTAPVILSIKINSADFADGGFDEAESREMAHRLEAAGVDLIELSGGTWALALSPAITLLSTPTATSRCRSRTRRKARVSAKRSSSSACRAVCAVHEADALSRFADRMRPGLSRAKLCVTGGFRSAEGMVRALEGSSTDMIGLARPLTAEPHLCADLLAGKTAAARENLVNEAVQVPASYVQVGALGEGRPVPDLSDENVARRIEKAVQESGAASMLYRAKY